jgi:hypothetical protein
MSKVEVNQISSQCGSTLTIGQSGDTVTLAAGATQSGFGRTGTVDWDTTAKTASFTAVSGNGYFVNTTSGAVTMTLPASPSAGDIVSVKDYAGTFGTNNLTIARNGSNLDGNAGDKVVSTDFQSFTMVYVDGTQGWIATGSGSDTIGIIPAYITATGGTVTCCGNYKIHTFTGPGTFCVSCAGNPLGSDTVDYMVVAGGAAGGSVSGGGGGAGGWRASSGAASGCYTAGPGPLTSPVSALPVTTTGYPVTVGAGGAASGSTSPEGPNGNPGNNSVFSTVTSTGGGGGSSRASPGGSSVPGGSGGGGSASVSGGTGNTPPVSPPQGNTGGNGINTPTQGGGGGGGAGAVGTAGASQPSGVAGGAGGVGVTSCISGSPVAYAGGGGGGINGSCSVVGAASPCGTGGRGGRYAGAPAPLASTAGTTNRGGGGGGGGADGPANGGDAAGGSGIVIIRYRYQ